MYYRLRIKPSHLVCARPMPGSFIFEHPAFGPIEARDMACQMRRSLVNQMVWIEGPNTPATIQGRTQS